MTDKTEINDWVAFVKERIDVTGVEDVHVDDVSATAGGLSAQIIRLTIRAAEGSKSFFFFLLLCRQENFTSALFFFFYDWVAFVKERIDVTGVEDVHVDDVSATAGGLSAQIIRLTIRAAEGSKSVILKRTRPERLEGSIAMGIAREAEFFTHFASLVDADNAFVPKVYYSAVECDGYKVVLMEDLNQRNGVQAGYFYGSNSLLNWGKDLKDLTKHFPAVSEHEITVRAFEQAARLHARFWGDNTLLARKYLRAAEWLTHLFQRCTTPRWSATAYKVVLMEDLNQRNGVQAGYFYGSNSLLNWGKDLKDLTKHFPAVSEHEITVRAFEQAARLHARFWGDNTLLARKYLRAAEWLQGENKELFDSTAKYSTNAWASFKKAQEEKKTVNISPEIDRLVASTASKVDFAAYTEMWKTKPWTMVHGDYHPANMMLVDGVHHATFDLMLLDWEAVGVGSGPQDLGQFMISHSTPENRRASEKEALAAYEKVLNEGLVARGLEPVTTEYILSEYVEGGLSRWAWLLAICVLYCPPAGGQYFHDQVLAFLNDHNVVPEEVGMMRP
ncbi:Hypothetical protein, putative [Bodo saltans]|uniref:Aminoglycoside phosphotransferase domain-containing protein n=1 Tax=Bodo saltans TaxID=75058 RepID=A0A0S4J6T3_BODSA|nr:Hypothetical protein, putative [Bodo saltans]|eukprot:CUG85477.1 Hypothetical protein, putative [Bodo saltans]